MIEWVPPAFIFILGALLVPLFKGRAQKVYILLLPLLAFTDLLSTSQGTNWVYNYLGYELIFGQVDKLTMVFAYAFVIMAFIGILYALHIKEQGQHISAFLYIGSALGVVFAGDLFSLFIFWEIMAFSSVFLVWYQKDKASYDAGFRYLLIHTAGGLFLLAGIVIRVVDTGSIEFGHIGLDGLDSYLILIGFLINAAVPPLHAWLSDAYPEATITGAVFMTAFTTKSAVYVLLRGYSGTEILIYLGAIMALYGVVYAVLENDIRRLLAYHIISQVGYMVAGVGMGAAIVGSFSQIQATPGEMLATNGAAAHAFAHILYKGLLFMGAGAVIYMTGKRKLTELGGLYKTMPITLSLYMVGGFAISAVPLFSGFVSKTMVIAGAEKSHLTLIFLMLTFASAGTFLHTGLKLPYFTFFAKDSGIRVKEPPINMLLAMGVAAFMCILVGVYPQILYNMLPYPVDYNPFTVGHVVGELQLLLFTAFGFFLLVDKLYGERTISVDTDWFYRKSGKVFNWFINDPLAKISQWPVDVCLKIISFLKWFSKNPVLAGILFKDTLTLHFLGRIGNRTQMDSMSYLETEKKLYPKNPVKRNPVGDSLLLALVFMSIYVLYYLINL
ncbi:MAG TPA: Na(+)/H(+) antiporter subunit D [Candidatus Nanoarchaeia archaeon]|nr:Na(+)/H(+) antiporter subunit D [Candidatus Nanoarchaeia archaeon]